MIEENKIRELLSERIEGSDLFLVDINMGRSNEIRVLVDSMEGVRIEECAELSRWLTAELNQDEEDFSLEVSSPGIGSPLLLRQQYMKNIGREVEVLFKDGKKKKGLLKNADDKEITLEVMEKQLAGGSQKKKKSVPVSKTFAFDDIKSTKVVITF